MKLKLQLIQDGKTVFEIPLSPMDWPKKDLENEFKAAEEDFAKFSKMFDALSHETRLRMMKQVIEEEGQTINFADFMKELDLNPKIVWENSRKLEEGGFLEKTGRGRYSCSDFGRTAFMMMSLTLHRLMESIQEVEEDGR